MQTMLAPHSSRSWMTLWEPSPVGTPVSRTRGASGETAPSLAPADLGGDVLKERDGLLVVGHEGSPETDVQQIHARQGRRLALGEVKDILEGAAEPVGQPDGIPADRPW